MAGALDFVFSPVTAAEFFATSFERAPLHVARHEPGYFSDIYSVQEVERSLTIGSREPQHFQLVKLGSPPVDASAYSEPRLGAHWRSTGRGPRIFMDPRKLAAYFHRGYTLLISDGALFSPSVQRLCNQLQAELGGYVQANVYMTPRTSQGFAMHHDTHDTLTIQVEGSKAWRVYEPVVQLPLETQPFDGSNVRGLPLEREVTLHAGDTLYLPRGYPHEATSASVRSLHVTFGLLPARVIDVVDELIRNAGLDDIELRRSVPRDWDRDEASAQRWIALLRERLSAALTPQRLHQAIDNAKIHNVALGRASSDEMFAQIERIATLSPESVVTLNDAVPYLMRPGPFGVAIVLNGKTISMPKGYDTAIERLREGPAALESLLPDRSQDERRAFAESLVIEGLLLIDR
jgi:ribosomal protein L16 Arg81 hydroxylase